MTATLLGVMCPDQVVETKSDQDGNLGGEEGGDLISHEPVSGL